MNLLKPSWLQAGVPGPHSENNDTMSCVRERERGDSLRENTTTSHISPSLSPPPTSQHTHTRYFQGRNHDFFSKDTLLLLKVSPTLPAQFILER